MPTQLAEIVDGPSNKGLSKALFGRGWVPFKVRLMGDSPDTVTDIDVKIMSVKFDGGKHPNGTIVTWEITGLFRRKGASKDVSATKFLSWYTTVPISAENFRGNFYEQTE